MLTAVSSLSSAEMPSAVKAGFDLQSCSDRFHGMESLVKGRDNETPELSFACLI